MDDRDLRADRTEARADVDQTARIRAHDDVRTRRKDARDLLTLELRSYIGMREVVDARAATAALRIADLHQRDALDGTQQRAWLLTDLLTVREMTGVLIHDAERTGRRERRRSCDLGQVTHARGEHL